MENKINNEDIIISFKASKDKKQEKKDGIINIFLSVFIFKGFLGGGTVLYNLKLTKKNLYIDNIGYGITGELETFVTEKISREDIISFKIIKEENEEKIVLIKRKGKKLIFIIENPNELNLASEMGKLLNK